ncbi:hypothetical protein FS837_004307, partial [Tulasnella sp. UAMH 9824]
MAPPDSFAYVLARILRLRTLEMDPTRGSVLHSPTSVPEQKRAPVNFPDAISASHPENATPFVSLESRQEIPQI